MLLKASGDTRSHKLWTILLIEADFNMNNKAMGNDIMRLGEQKSLDVEALSTGSLRRTF